MAIKFEPTPGNQTPARKSKTKSKRGGKRPGAGRKATSSDAINDASEKPTVGRPSKYKAGMCDLVLMCGEEGGTVAEMADACDVTISTLYLWKDEHPEFSEAFTRAQEKAEVCWARKVREGLAKPPSEFQGQANLKYMGQRFQDRWSEKNRLELSGPNGSPIPIQEIRRTIVDPKPRS
jgi:transposase-like protein